MEHKKNGQFAGECKVDVTCRQCGNTFSAYQAWIKKGGGKFCSKPCYDLSQRKSVTVRDDGYIQVKMPDHLRANKWGFIYEHILIAEKKIGRPLNKREVVHHINGNPSDNTPDNLLIFDSRGAHTHYHADQRLITIGVNPKTEKRCPKCTSILLKSSFARSSSRGKKCLSSWCKPCNAKYAMDRKSLCQ